MPPSGPLEFAPDTFILLRSAIRLRLQHAPDSADFLTAALKTMSDEVIEQGGNAGQLVIALRGAWQDVLISGVLVPYLTPDLAYTQLVDQALTIFFAPRD